MNAPEREDASTPYAVRVIIGQPCPSVDDHISLEGVEHDGWSFFAFGADGRLIGTFDTCADAMAAIPRRLS
jgi:hypothetical protein